MSSSVRVIVWEQVWKSRVVFPALAVLLALSAVLTFGLAHAAADVWWARTARGAIAVSLLASLLLGIAPFTLMESHHGWRMNSMVTRWFVLPVPTSLLVLAPLAVACGVIALLVAAWTPVLHRLIPEFDTTYLLVVLVSGVAAIQALAWMLPRKPSQFWPMVGLLFPVMLVLAVAPQEAPQWAARRLGMIRWVASAIPLFALAGYIAARRHRCGDWPGGLPLEGLRQWLVGSRPKLRAVHSPATALFWSDTVAVVRVFLLSWLAFGLLLTGSQVFLFLQHRPQQVFTLKLCAFIGLQILPFLGVVWLAAGGLFVAGETGAGFRTRLSSFRATLPVSAGTLAAQRLTAALLVWLVVWVPLLGCLFVYGVDLTGLPSRDAARELAGVLARLMTVSACALIGALPVYLWGRFEGFPNLLLCAIVSWAGPWGLSMCLATQEGQPRPWAFALGWLAVKVLVATWALAHAWRRSYISGRFVTGLVGGWLALSNLLIWALPTGPLGDGWQAVGILLFMPLARPALCPLAIAANRHR